MITNPNMAPVKAQNNATTTPKTTGMVANNGVKQNAPIATKPTATVVKQPALIPKTATAPQTRITAGAKLPHDSQTARKLSSSGTANEAPQKVAAPKTTIFPQANTAMPHQGKADKNGVKFVGVETMPKENDNATTRGYAMITQVPVKSYGVDVSNYQGTDLSPYARQGAKFAIVKLTEGTGYINPNAAGQIASAKANDMLAMGYVFAHSGGNTAEAKQEAEYGLAEAQRAGLPKGSYIAYDYEVGASGSIPANTAAIETFMQTILHGGYLPLLYSGNAYLHAHVNVNQVTNDYKGSLWVASYPTMGATSTPNWNYFPSNPGVAMWQFTDDWKGMKVDGDVATLPLSMEGTQTTVKPAPAPATKPSTTQPQSKPAANNNSKPMTQPTANKPSTTNSSNVDPKVNIRHLPIKNSKPSNTSADDPTTTQTAGTSKQAPTTTKLPDININVAANAQAKAKANANANVNVKTNSNATGKEQAKAYGLGSVMPTQMTCDNSYGGSAVEGQTTPVATAGLGVVEAVGGYQATSPATTTVTMPQAVSSGPVQGQRSVAMPATGQKNGSVLTDLAVVAVTMLGESMLLKKRNA